MQKTKKAARKILKDIQTRDLLLAAGAFSTHGLLRPAGYYALQALKKLPQPEHASVEENYLLAELEPKLGPESGYLPGFLQTKVRSLVALANQRGENNSIHIPAKLSPDDWSRLESNLGESISRLRQSKREIKLTPGDFRNLFTLRSMIQLWAPIFEQRLQESGHQVTLDSISRVNQTSGYIWVAFLPSPNRKKVEQPTFSLSFTPTHLRVGLELGGRTAIQRQCYYEKLIAGELDEILTRLAAFNCVLADLAWFSTIRATTPIQDYLYLSAVREAIQEKCNQALKRLGDKHILTWNLALPAMIRTAQSFSPQGEEIEDILLKIADPILELIRLIG